MTNNVKLIVYFPLRSSVLQSLNGVRCARGAQGWPHQPCAMLGPARFTCDAPIEVLKHASRAPLFSLSGGFYLAILA